MAGDQRFKIMNYDGGLLNHPTPEASGALLLKADRRWELHFGTDSELNAPHQMSFGTLDRYPFDAKETGATSCRVTIPDLQQPTAKCSFDLPDTALSTLQVALGSDVTFIVQQMSNYDGGMPFYPTPEANGTLVLRYGRWELHFFESGTTTNGGVGRYPFDVVETGPSSCHVVTQDKQDPSIRGGFDLPQTPAALLRAALASQVKFSQIESTLRANTAQWWAGIRPAKLSPVMLPTNLKAHADLQVTADGITWANGKIKFSWSALRKIESGTHRVQKGKQHSAFGIGPIGVALVAANAIHNANARQIVEYRLIRITDGLGKQFNFVTPRSTAEVVAALAPTAQALEAHLAAPPKPAPAVAPQAPTTPTPSALLGVADELRKLGDLKVAGLLSDEEFEVQKAKLLNS